MDAGVRDAYVEGVAAVLAGAATIDAAGWDGPSACAGWSNRDLAGHLLLVVRAYDEHHRGAVAHPGVPVRFKPGRERRVENERAVRALPPSSGPDRIARFAEEAGAYLGRVERMPSVLYQREEHVFTAAEHLATAAIEFHLHAWDLDRSRSPPACAAALADAWRAHLPYRIGDGDPWPAVLEASGRTAEPR